MQVYFKITIMQQNVLTQAFPLGIGQRLRDLIRRIYSC